MSIAGVHGRSVLGISARALLILPVLVLLAGPALAAGALAAGPDDGPASADDVRTVTCLSSARSAQLVQAAIVLDLAREGDAPDDLIPVDGPSAGKQIPLVQWHQESAPAFRRACSALITSLSGTAGKSDPDDDSSWVGDLFSGFGPAFFGALFGSLATLLSALAARRREFAERVQVSADAFHQAVSAYLVAVVKSPSDAAVRSWEVYQARNTATTELSKVAARYADWNLPRVLRGRLESGPLGTGLTDDWQGELVAARDTRIAELSAELAVAQAEFARVSRGVLALRRRFRRDRVAVTAAVPVP
jgi:hypothetical protein